MNIRGIYKTSFIDYPGKIASVIYIGGCNLRCRFCHNPDLVSNDESLDTYKDQDIFIFLNKRNKLIDGVVISGGEPTMDPGLLDFLRELRKGSLSIKLDTNGMLPEVVRACISEKLVDYIALDIKTAPSKYLECTGDTGDFGPVRETLRILKDSKVAYELRTTCVPGYMSLEDIEELKPELTGAPRYYLQQFVSNVPLLESGLEEVKPFSVIELEMFHEAVASIADVVELRGI